jgi:peptidoglycan/LPS O-acetylase OafA/YrhL
MQKRMPELDAVRGIAVLAVIIHNAPDKYPYSLVERFAASGWMGVDLFFVLSGFLITGILLDSQGSQDYFRNFYARRCLRIWPLYYLLLVCLFVAVPLMSSRESALIFSARSSPWWAFPLFLQNFLVSRPAGAVSLLGVTWSLAVEEQFYLVWPWVVRYCSGKQLRRISVAVICLSPPLRLYLSSHGVDIYSNLFCRLDGLMAGGLLALLARSTSFQGSKFTRAAWGCLLVSAPLAVWMDAPANRWFVHSLAALAAVSFVYLTLYWGQNWFRAILTNRFLVYAGTISYGLYLLHKIPFDLAKLLGWPNNPLLVTPIVFAVTFGLASLSWNLWERPFLALKSRFAATSASESAGAVRSGSRSDCPIADPESAAIT